MISNSKLWKSLKRGFFSGQNVPLVLVEVRVLIYIFRYFHQAVCSPVSQEIYVYGGIVKNKAGAFEATNEFWKFSTGARVWTRLDVNINLLKKKVIVYPLVMNSQYMFREFSFYYFFLENVLITNGKCRALVIEASFKNQFTGKKHAKPMDLSRNFLSALQHSIWLLSCYAKMADLSIVIYGSVSF